VLECNLKLLLHTVGRSIKVLLISSISLLFILSFCNSQPRLSDGRRITCSKERFNCPSYSGAYKKKKLANCEDVTKVYNYCLNDPHGLDSSNDGKPCNADCYAMKSYSFDQNKKYKVERVIDGDTIVIEQQKIRVLYINTPESVHPERNKNSGEGEIVSNWAKEILQDELVKLDCKKTVDRYKRSLCHVYVKGQNYASLVIEKGFSTYYTDYGYSIRYNDKFKALQDKAKKYKCGLWNDFKKVCSIK
jgi:micrococcal nuclease